MGLDALAVRGRAFVDELCDRGGTDERNAFDPVVVDQVVDGVLATVDELDDAIREAGLVDELEEFLGDQRVLLARLENETVSGRDRVGEEPQRDHAGEVKRRNRGERAEWLPDCTLVDFGRGVQQRAALHHRRNATGDFDVLDAATEFTARFCSRFPVILHEDLCEFVEVLLEEGLQFEQRLDSLLDGTTGPVFERFVRRSDGVVNVVRRTERNPSQLLTGCRVRRYQFVVALWCYPVAADVVSNRICLS